MKTPLILALSAATALSACQTGGGLPPTAPTPSEAVIIAAEIATAPKADRLKIVAGVATEVGARFRCPANALELDILTSARLTFDLFVRGHIAAESAAIVDRLRSRTNLACGIVDPAPGT